MKKETGAPTARINNVSGDTGVKSLAFICIPEKIIHKCGNKKLKFFEGLYSSTLCFFSGFFTIQEET